MISSPLEKDVEAKLLNKRVRLRKPGEVPYPLVYSADILNFDYWDHMFFVSCCRGLTMHQFDKPPNMVLDLGCGSGFWAIEAARQWKSSTIIGFDVKDIQPRLCVLDLHRDLAHRMKWVHGNLLDGLPFLPNYFDFVRIAGVGLGVPEDEWQFVLEEVARIMKPGAVLEIIEEDLIFPCGPPPRSRPRPPPLTVDLPVSKSIPSSTYSTTSFATQSSGISSGTLDEHSHFSLKKNPSLNNPHKSYNSIPSPTLSFNPPFNAKASFHSLPSHRPTDQDSTNKSDPRDHTRLKSAWDAMLSSRFLAPKLVTVLPFYLSSCFVDVRTSYTLQIPLPPNSLPRNMNGTSEDVADRSRTISEEFSPSLLFNSTSLEMSSNEKLDITSINPLSQHAMPLCSTMHLAKTVATINGCKESIWIEYEKLYGDDPSIPPVTRTTRPNKVHLMSSKPSAREAFDLYWSRWEKDMTDRIGMRRTIVSEFAWEEPPKKPVKPGSSKDFSYACVPPPGKPELCRSLRGFVGWKPS